MVLLLDRPALMRESDQLLHRRGGRQIDEEVFGAWRGAQILFAQEPDLGSQPSIAPVVGGGDADGREAGRPGAIRPVAPGHPSPRARGQRQRQGAHGDRPRVVHEHQLRSRPARARTRRDMDGRRAGKHREMPRDPDGIRQTPAMQRSSEGGDVAELGVGEHGRDLQPRGARAADQRQRLTPFLLEDARRSESAPPRVGRRR